MAKRRSFAFVGHKNVERAVRARLLDAGYQYVQEPAAADVVVTYCTSLTQLEDVCYERDGLVQSARPGSLIIDLSPSTPSFARELSAVSTVHDIAAVEAPLVVVDPTPADAFADKDNLACFVGGEEDEVERAMPVVECIAGAVTVTGGVGSAQLARAAYSLQSCAQVVSAIEADALYRAFRLSPVSSGQVEGRAGALTPLGHAVLQAIDTGSFSGTYTTEMFMAELSASLTAADDYDLILPQAESVMQLLEILAVIGGSDMAPTALSLIYDEESACAEHGLDWSRAEQAFGESHGGGDGHDQGHAHDGDYGDYDDFDFGYDEGMSGGRYPDYSSN